MVSSGESGGEGSIVAGDLEEARAVLNMALAVMACDSLPQADPADTSAIEAIMAGVEPVDESKQSCFSSSSWLEEYSPELAGLLALAEVGVLLGRERVDQILESARKRVDFMQLRFPM